MTIMGLDYLKYQESRRSNLANEAIKSFHEQEVKRNNEAIEALRNAELDETKINNLRNAAQKSAQTFIETAANYGLGAEAIGAALALFQELSGEGSPSAVYSNWESLLYPAGTSTKVVEGDREYDPVATKLNIFNDIWDDDPVTRLLANNLMEYIRNNPDYIMDPNNIPEEYRVYKNSSKEVRDFSSILDPAQQVAGDRIGREEILGWITGVTSAGSNTIKAISGFLS